MQRPELSLILPIFNEAQVLPRLDVRLKELLGQLNVDTEVIFVNDGSTDGSIDVLRRMTSHELRYRVVGFSRRFGHQHAITAGMDKSRGRAVIVFDAELLLDPTGVIMQMVAKWHEGFDVVYGRRASHAGRSALKRLTARIFRTLVDQADVPLDTGDLQLMSRRVVTTMRGLRETHRFVRSLVAWVGFKQTSIEYDSLSAESKVSLRTLIAFAVDGITSFTTRPLRFASYAGLFVGFLTMLYTLVAFIAWCTDVALPGANAAPPAIVIVIATLFSIQFFLIGVLGEYVGRIYEQTKRRPLYVVSEQINFDPVKVERLVTQDIEEFQTKSDSNIAAAEAAPPPVSLPPPLPFPEASSPGMGAGTRQPSPSFAKSPSKAPPAMPTSKPPPKLSSSVANIHVAPVAAKTPSSPPTPAAPAVKFPSVPPPKPAASTSTSTSTSTNANKSGATAATPRTPSVNAMKAATTTTTSSKPKPSTPPPPKAEADSKPKPSVPPPAVAESKPKPSVPPPPVAESKPKPSVPPPPVAESKPKPSVPPPAVAESKPKPSVPPADSKPKPSVPPMADSKPKPSVPPAKADAEVSSKPKPSVPPANADDTSKSKAADPDATSQDLPKLDSSKESKDS